MITNKIKTAKEQMEETYPAKAKENPQNKHEHDRILSPAEVARRFRISRTTVYRMILGFKGQSPTLPAHKLGEDVSKKHWYIWESDVIALLKKHQEIKKEENK
jgi:predicted DNA-binding transcriptional regulator AlpA